MSVLIHCLPTVIYWSHQSPFTSELISLLCVIINFLHLTTDKRRNSALATKTEEEWEQNRQAAHIGTVIYLPTINVTLKSLCQTQTALRTTGAQANKDDNERKQ